MDTNTTIALLIGLCAALLGWIIGGHLADNHHDKNSEP